MSEVYLERRREPEQKKLYSKLKRIELRRLSSDNLHSEMSSVQSQKNVRIPNLVLPSGDE